MLKKKQEGTFRGLFTVDEIVYDEVEGDTD